MQTSQIPEQPIIELLKKNPVWHTRFRTSPQIMPCILDAFPDGTPEKVVMAKLKIMIKRKLINGCTCGCRGDFHISN